MKLWTGRFHKELDKKTNDFNSSIRFDSRMAKEDIEGSIAHATMLGACGVIDQKEAERICAGLEGILADLESGALEIDPEAEDIHTFVEAELTARREAQQPGYTPKPLDLSEYKTRKLYIDAMLTDAGWTEGKDWINEVELPGMPNKSEVGYADYVLYDDAHRPLAVIEAKRTCVDPAKGRQQAKLYADLLEKKYGRRR